MRLIRRGKVDDEALQFTKHRAPVGGFGLVSMLAVPATTTMPSSSL